MIEAILHAYQNRLERLSAIALLIELSVLCFAIKIVPGIILAFVSSGPVQTTTDFQLDRESPLFVLITASFIAPPLETIIGQWLPLLCMTYFTQKRSYRLLIPTLWFALWHVYAGWVSVLIVFFPGLVFTMCFMAQWEQGLWRAFWTTTVVHALHNFLSLLFYFTMVKFIA